MPDAFSSSTYHRPSTMPSRSAAPRSRQKSCVACAEGKRRCNRQTPQCSRCAGRGLTCIYINGPPAKKHQQVVPAEVRTIEFENFHDLDDIFSLWSPNSDSLIDSSTATASCHAS